MAVWGEIGLCAERPLSEFGWGHRIRSQVSRAGFPMRKKPIISAKYSPLKRFISFKRKSLSTSPSTKPSNAVRDMRTEEQKSEEGLSYLIGRDNQSQQCAITLHRPPISVKKNNLFLVI